MSYYIYLTKIYLHLLKKIFRLTVTKETPNKGRQFYGCSKPMSQSDKCSFFLWADQSASTALNIAQPPNRNNNNRSFSNNTFRARNSKSQFVKFIMESKY